MNGSSFGPRLIQDGVAFRLWAPAAQRVDLQLDGSTHEMHRDEGGWFTRDVAHAHAGMRYRFLIDGETEVPDPASPFQPDDIAGPSEVIDHRSYGWRATDWRGRPWEDAVFVETHVGTFTPEGTYRAMIDKLDHLVATGITALELMPVADFPGRWNWGYDGALWYAPDSSYGRPDDLKALIDEAHLRGLMVFLDVVYNHFGPEGNYLGLYAPSFFSSAQTPWGNAIDYRVPEVRQFAVENALHWLRTYRFDGLRLDAVHAIETAEDLLLRDISIATGAFARSSGRHIHLVLENDDNRASLLDPFADPPAGKYRAQWNDDYHHAWHVLLTGETFGYYQDYQPPLPHLVRALESGFAYQGESSAHRDNALRGEPSGYLSPAAFVNFLQNHDQIGNRALGDRLACPPAALEAALAITLLAPMPPMLFMGEEWGATSPFPFFCDFKGDLAQAVREGRRREYRKAYEAFGDDVPDPVEQTTFVHAKLNWQELQNPDGQRRHELVRKLLGLRREHIIPHLRVASFGEAHVEPDGILFASWALNDHLLTLTANLSSEPSAKETPHGRHMIWGKSGLLGPWSVCWTTESA
ncbi:malto-oligosyltrehalose trehalohydrolase [Afipia felis]|uniref:Malto-oligosyltrehalose trehalohydrolase n=2 Tax=Afipia felis TaxID=1035 RepID=A0A380WA75_AFIFE|nr:malto-oligosyltrehalose trehalohydrolase [Afipia felis]EKS29102.1 malto-oligosyltrehalose trehalohydrolase [Afipia felis ATCC 53690]SUU77809.1 Malto-oligosyltrehalose trehalohydrolase [Afipia felis]SUU85874.1 Malto-oligosyltrehalose trehalohydrolase [Afipia felis]